MGWPPQWWDYRLSDDELVAGQFFQPHRPASLLDRCSVVGYEVHMKLDRQVVTKSALRGHADDNYVPGTEAERLAMVWPITHEIAALSPQHNVERRLQKHLVRVFRRKCSQ